MPPVWNSQDKKKFLTKVKKFYWDDPYLFKYSPDQIFRRCIPNDEISSVIKFCHSEIFGDHFSLKKSLQKSCNVDFIGLPYLKTRMLSGKLVKIIKSLGPFQKET